MGMVFVRLSNLIEVCERERARREGVNEQEHATQELDMLPPDLQRLSTNRNGDTYSAETGF